MVNHMRPAPLPDAVIVVAIGLVARDFVQTPGCGEAFGLHPEVLLVRTNAAIWRDAVIYPAVVSVPSFIYGPIIERFSSRQPFRVGTRLIQDKQQLRPFGLVTRLKSPWTIAVIGRVDIICHIDIPVQIIMLPDFAAGLVCKFNRKSVCQPFGPVKIFGLRCGVPCGEEGLAHMHIRILPAIGRQDFQARVQFVCIGTRRAIPEVRLHKIEYTREDLVRRGNPGLHAARRRQKHKGMPIGHHAVIRNLAAIEQPGIAAIGLPVMLRQIAQPMFRPVAVFGLAIQAVSRRVIKDISRRANQLTALGVETVAIIQKTAAKSASVRKYTFIIKGERRLNMRF